MFVVQQTIKCYKYEEGILKLPSVRRIIRNSAKFDVRVKVLAKEKLCALTRNAFYLFPKEENEEAW